REVARIDEHVRHNAVFVAEVMLRKPGVVVAEFVCAQDFTGHARVDVTVRIGLGIRVGMGCEQDAEFHVALLAACDWHHPIVSEKAQQEMPIPSWFLLCAHNASTDFRGLPGYQKGHQKCSTSYTCLEEFPMRSIAVRCPKVGACRRRRKWSLLGAR